MKLDATPVAIEGIAAAEGRIARLEEASFASAASGPEGFLAGGQSVDLGRIELAPYAVARLAVPG